MFLVEVLQLKYFPACSILIICMHMCFSGFSGTEQPRGGVSGAGAAAGGACDGRGGDDPRPDSFVREAGGGAVHPRQHSTLRRHVS